MNRLASERSPYLLQHAAQSRGLVSLGQTRRSTERDGEDKPIFLSIGYSTCHWCHVMEHESFENATSRTLLNAGLRVHQGRSRRTAGRRPRLHVVRAGDDGRRRLADVGVPHAGAETVLRRHLFPAVVALGPAGILDLLGELARVWKDDRPRVDQAAAELFDRLKVVTGTGGRSACRESRRRADALDVGSRAVPDDVRPPPRRLWRCAEVSASFRAAVPAAGTRAPRRGWRRRQTPLLMVTDTLRAMALGGMRDHIGGGFHRYSVDAEWRVPHFEKMLYDQAQLVLAYLEAAQATGDDFYATVAEDTLDYVLRDLTDARRRVLFR